MFELKFDTKDKSIISEDFNIDVSVVTEDSTQLIEKMELLDLILISGQNDGTRVTRISRTSIDLALQVLHAPLNLLNTQSLIIMMLKLTSSLDS